MNNERRKAIAKAREIVAEALSLMEIVRDDEYVAHGAIGAIALEETIEALEGAFDKVEGI
jgi:hypothetical protein